MIRTEESKRLWKLAEASQDWEAMDKIESEWQELEHQDESYYDERVDWDSSTYEDDFFEAEEQKFWDCKENWTGEDEATLEEHEERKRQRIAEANEY